MAFVKPSETTGMGREAEVKLLFVGERQEVKKRVKFLCGGEENQ